MDKKADKSTSNARRLSSIDALRGLVIVVMALDHSRDFFGDLRIDPIDPETTTVGFFFTRWITHFCAPTFVFLAGVSAWLYGEKRPYKRDLSKFLFTRGLWLIFLEYTVIYFSLALSISFIPWLFLVIGAIGFSMIVLAGLCLLPHRIVLACGLIVVLGHNLLDGISSESFGWFSGLWIFLHGGPGYIPWLKTAVAYPVLPWVGVMACGYGFAPIFRLPTEERSRKFLLIGVLLVAGFLVVRSINAYGDPNPWRFFQYANMTESIPNAENGKKANSQQEALTSDSENNELLKVKNSRPDYFRTTFSFLNTTKYPPSLLYLLMTLGPAIIVLSILERQSASGFLIRHLCVFGNVPLFFYVLHFYILHLSSIATYWIVRGKALSPFQTQFTVSPETPFPEEYGFAGLGQIYLAWVILLTLMYPLCLYYGRLKRAGKSKLWSYL